jgi:glutamyl-tRNA synthetase
MLDLFLPRARTFAELDAQVDWLFAAPAAYDEKAVAKHLVKGGGAALLRPLADALAAHGAWDVAGLEAGLAAIAEALGVGLGKVAQPIRVALTGAAASPSIYDCLALVGRDEAVSRLRACAAAVGA